MHISFSNNNLISENTINYNTEIGISLYESDYNIVIGNNLKGNGNCIEEQSCEGNKFGNNDYCSYGVSVKFVLKIVLWVLVGSIISVFLIITLMIYLRKNSSLF